MFQYDNGVNTRAKLDPPFRGYEIDMNGDVFSTKRNRVLTPLIDRNGYLMVRMYDGRGYRCARNVGRLVAETFLRKPSAQADTILYKDYDKTNCHVENLRWVTRTYGMRYERQVKDRERFDKFQQKVRVKYQGDDFLPVPCGTIAEAAEKYGLLYNEVLISAREENPCPSDPRLIFSSEYPIDLL